MRAEHLPKLLVAALADEEEIDLAKRRRKAIGVVMLVLDPVAPRGQDAVVRAGSVGQLPDDADEQFVVRVAR